MNEEDYYTDNPFKNETNNMTTDKTTIIEFLDGLAAQIGRKLKFSTGEVLNLIFDPSKSKQSAAIQVGNEMKRLISFLITKAGFSLTDGRTTTLVIGKKTKYVSPHISFLIGRNEEHYIVQSSLDLDTTKTAANIEKIKAIASVNSGSVSLLCMSYYSEEDVPATLSSRWNEVNVLYAEDLFEKIGTDITKEEYYKTWKDFGNKLV